MDEKTKLYVFAKKEVALIFIFMILIALTSFFFGVKVGKGFSYEKSSLEPIDRKTLDLLSGQEEKVNEVVEKTTHSASKAQVEIKDSNKLLEERLKEELSAEGESKKIINNNSNSDDTSKKKTEILDNQAVQQEVESNTMTIKKNDFYSGKYTIQLGAYRSLEEAEEFAQGFKVRGYNPIISEAEIPNRGVWYRVSLGAFDSVTEAKEYVKSERTLFQGQDIVFRRFD